jgi:curved DNA-binding protein CbpA
MKDFYKILGVKEDASEEEIRERWVELTKQHHPDRSEESASNEKIREINEAYQVLKYSSTRVEYDLKRAFNHGDRERKGTVYFKRWGIPASILIILIILGVIYIRNHQSPPSSEPIVSNKIDSINQTNQRNEINQTNQMSQIDQRNQTDEKDQKNHINQTNQKDQKDQRNQRTPSIAVAATMKKVQLPQPPQNRITPLPNDVVANKPTTSINKTDQRNQINEINQTDQINLSRLPGSESVRGEMRSLSHWDQTDKRNQKNQTNLNVELAQFKPPPLLATEDEVKKFFNNYVNFYDRKDAKGILSLFSAKAIQNQKDGLEEIRKIYADFFSEGQGIHFSLQDMKIEIYQNAVEVKARYEIEQIVRETVEKEVWRGPIRWVLIKEDGKLRILFMDYKYQRPL